VSNRQSRIGIVSFRQTGTDGVSLEIAKWSKILEDLGHECFYFAGDEESQCNENTYWVPEAHFKHPEIKSLHEWLFGRSLRSAETSQDVQRLKDHFKGHLEEFVYPPDGPRLDLLIAENVLSIPMNVPLGLALTDLIGEKGIPTIGHHHDFYWERGRFRDNAIPDYLAAAFPPILPSVNHVVINSFGASELALRTGLSSTLIPNVMDFKNPPAGPDGYADDLPTELDIDGYLLLQPTRVVPRKGIERAIELARRLERLGFECTLVISHSYDDEDSDYKDSLEEFAELMGGVPVRFAAERVAHQRDSMRDGSKVYSLADIYQKADLVTFPSMVEGFGNAFLEAIYYRRPIVVSTYDIYRRDIRPKGFEVIEFGDYITEDAVRRAQDVLCNPALASEMTEKNYELGRRYFSYQTLEKRLVALISECLGDY
jgi:glycosyltransferase involved in cell wall biosynthesis